MKKGSQKDGPVSMKSAPDGPDGKGSFLRDKDRDNSLREVDSDAAAEMPTQGDGQQKDEKTDNRLKWVHATCQKKVQQITKEYLRNKKMKPLGCTFKEYEKHEEKNRYNDILCIDTTRVILKGRPENDDYIHASWITLPDGNKYICTQAPLVATFQDFWHMIITEKCASIVMLCAIEEAGETKCDRYFPHPGRKISFGPFEIRHKEKREDLSEGIAVNEFEAAYKDQTHKVVHYMYTLWTDHVAPLDPAPVIKLLRTVKTEAKNSTICVHCSAGIGRTSTFVGIDFAAQKIKENGNYDLIEAIMSLRSMRFHAIQGPCQYMFLTIAVVEYFVQENYVKRTAEYQALLADYKKKMQSFERKKTGSKASKDEKEGSKKKKKKK